MYGVLYECLSLDEPERNSGEHHLNADNEVLVACRHSSGSGLHLAVVFVEGTDDFGPLEYSEQHACSDRREWLSVRVVITRN